jgi:glucose/arabinose dehydrogenase
MAMLGAARRDAPVRLALGAALLLIASFCAVVTAPTPAQAAVPPGFSEVTALTGLVQPTALRFAPDGRIFVAEKRGTIEMFRSLADTAPVRVADLRSEVYNYWDRGLLGLAVDPAFPARPYLYALYTYDGAIGQPAPHWGTAGSDSDPCPSPPGATTAGCVASSKLVRLTLNADNTTTKTDLIWDWCQQFPSHSVGNLAFGPDGALYVSHGDGASFNYADYGQTGNPCGDPGGPAGTNLTPPTGEGGSLRAQDLRTPSDPVSLDGAVLRVDPDTGGALPDNPNAAATDPNARRIVAYGLRNPFRTAFRPGTSELWVGDVGWNDWEEIDRLSPAAGATRNLGWPCYEGSGKNSAYDAAGLTLCRNLYADTAAVTSPFLTYLHGQPLSGSDTCRTANGSSISGLAFAPDSGGAYPSQYAGALFFSDFSRDCIWVMTQGASGLPDPSTVTPFDVDAAGPVDLVMAPWGELFYPDLDGGTIRRIVYTGSGQSCPTGQYRAQYFANTTLTGAATTTLCEGAPLNHDFTAVPAPGVGQDHFSARWSGTFDFAATATYTFTAVADDGVRVWVDGTPLVDQWQDRSSSATFTAARQLTAGTHTVTTEWYSASGPPVAALDWANTGTDAPPVPQIATPAAGTTWKVGDTLTFSGSATDAEDGVLPATALSWQVRLQHCPSACHTHVLQTFPGTSGGSVVAPDHGYPSYLELALTATDSAGQSTTVVRRLDPRTVPVTVDAQPRGLPIVLGGTSAVTPFTGTVIVGSTTSVSAATSQTLSGALYQFARWSDGGAATHTVVAGSAPLTLTATYTLVSCPVGSYKADYFANRTLSGTPRLSRCEAAPLNRQWKLGGPGGGVGTDNFSARWSGTFSFPGGSRTFTAVSDDGVRVWLDGALILNHWSGLGTAKTTRSVSAGRHTVKVEYYENTGPAHVQLTW